MFGTFTPESLKNFAEANGFNTKNVDFSEGIFDYKVCERPNKTRYGIPDDNKCHAPNKENEHGLMDRLKGKLAPYLSEEELINENKRPAKEAKARAEKAKAKKRAELKAKFDKLTPAQKQQVAEAKKKVAEAKKKKEKEKYKAECKNDKVVLAATEREKELWEMGSLYDSKVDNSGQIRQAQVDIDRLERTINDPYGACRKSG